MPHLIEQHEGAAAKQAAISRAPFGPGLSAEIAERTARLEVWGSSFNDPGEDWCEFVAIDAAGNKIATQRLAGY